MSIYNKVTNSVADAVTKIMNEKLHPNQQKLDVHEPEKDELTSDDFKKLRAGKKADVKEEAEQLKEYESKGGSYTHKGTYGYAGKGAEHGDTDYDKENELAKATDKPKKPNRGKYGARQNFKRSTRVNEAFSLMFDALKEKGLKGLEEEMSHQAATTMKHIKDPSPALKQAAKDIKPGVAGYKDRIDMLKAGGVKEEVEELDEVSLKTATSAYVKRMGKDDDKSPVKAVKTMDQIAKKHGVVGVARAAKAADKEYGLNDTTHNKRKDFVRGVMAGVKEEVEDLNESDIENGYKIRMKHIDKGRIHSPSGEHVATVTREHGEGWRYHSGNKNWDGLETSKHYKTGVEKTKVAAAKKAVQAHMNEEVDNETFTKEVEDQKKRAAGTKPQANIAKASVQAVQQEQTHTEIQVIDMTKADEPIQITKIDLEEREMTEPEMKKREEIVKGMKKGLAGFKERYGDRAKNVMYATATKNAMKEEKEDHHQKGYDHVREPISDEPYLDNARERFNELKKQNPHKKGTPEHKDWHSGASAAYEEHKDILRGN